jgi:pyruvate dehydrogenase E2 component (dihydrolipoamide acetyltransferase)
MTDADQRVVRATVTGEADITAWSTTGSPMLRLLRAISAAVAAAPRMNAWYDDRAGSISIQSAVDVGVAVETDDGLFVPVLADVAGKDAAQLASELARLKSAVEDRTIRPAELRGPTISLSDFGAVGGLHADMVVVPPQVAIVGAGRAFERVVLRDGAPEAAAILPLSVTFDHRVITGAEACTYLVALTADLELEQ